MTKSELIFAMADMPENAKVFCDLEGKYHEVEIKKVCQICPDGPDCEEPYILLQ